MIYDLQLLVPAGKILVSLWLPVNAEFWLRKATVTSGKKDMEAAVLFQKVRVKRLYGPMTEAFPVAVDFTQYGRAVLATEDIKAGEVRSHGLLCGDYLNNNHNNE